MAISQSACDTVLAAFSRARTISFDSNLRLKLWPLARARAMIGAAAAMSDYFFPSIEDARQLSGAQSIDENLAWAHGLGARTVFLKLGPDGVVVSDRKRSERIPGMKVKALDATGAGDCFCGAALARLEAGDSIWEAARYANAAAALATTGFGAVDPLPRPEQVRKLISTS
jgi:2-dehydro-3-deoxygluconokinase